MNDAEYDEQKARVQKLIERWPKALGLHWWRITYDWYRHDMPDDEGKPDLASAMRCAARWEYLDATIKINLELVATLEDARLEWIFVHELMHIFLKEQRWDDDDSKDSMNHEERVASMLAMAFIWIRDFVEEGKAPALKAEIDGP